MFLKSKQNRNYVFIFSLILTAIVVSVGILLPEKFNYISTKLFNVLIDVFIVNAGNFHIFFVLGI